MEILAEVRKLQSKYASDPKTKICLEDCLGFLEGYNRYIRDLLAKPITTKGD